MSESRPLSGYAPGVAEQLGYYVYLLIDPRDDTIFYVGKGTGERCFAHLRTAQTTKRDHTREFAKLERIREVERAGLDVRIDIVSYGLDERTAFTVECALIETLGLDELANAVSGHLLRRSSVAHLNAVLGARPITIAPEHRVMLVRLTNQYRPTLTPSELYEATRKWWRIGEKRTVPTHRSAAEWAFAVHGGVVRAVYRIEGWERPSPDVLAEDPRRVGRRAFVGRPDPALEERYVLGDVTAYLTPGAQNPITYANC